jgi:hypothetical protein
LRRSASARRGTACRCELPMARILGPSPSAPTTFRKVRGGGAASRGSTPDGHGFTIHWLHWGAGNRAGNCAEALLREVLHADQTVFAPAAQPTARPRRHAKLADRANFSPLPRGPTTETKRLGEIRPDEAATRSRRMQLGWPGREIPARSESTKTASANTVRVRLLEQPRPTTPRQMSGTGTTCALRKRATWPMRKARFKSNQNVASDVTRGTVDGGWKAQVLSEKPSRQPRRGPVVIYQRALVQEPASTQENPPDAVKDLQ